MTRLALASLLGFSALLTSPLLAQGSSRLGAEFVLGVAHRNSTSDILPTDGIQAAVRATFAVHRNLQLIGAASWIRLADQDRITPTFCLPPGVCVAARTKYPGLGVMGLAAGIQPIFPVGPVQLRVSGLTGGYWMYRHPSGLPSLAAGVEGALGLGLPIGGQMQVLLQGRMVHVFGSASSAVSSRQFAVGLAIN